MLESDSAQSDKFWRDMHLGPLCHLHNTVIERSQPMSEFLVSWDQFFNLYLAFETKLNILFF